MNPVIRILIFLVFGGFVAFGSGYELLIGFVFIVVLSVQNQFVFMPLCLKMLSRMRWFFLSILVLYLWFTPGSNSATSSFALIPSLDGLHQGLLRISSLVLIVVAVNYFIAPIARDKMVGAILWLLKPLHWMRFDNQRLAVRVALTFSLVAKAQQLLADSGATTTKEQDKSETSIRSRFSRAGEVVTQLFEKVMSEAVHTETQSIHVKTGDAPSALQWTLLVLMAVFFWGVPRLLEQNL